MYNLRRLLVTSLTLAAASIVGCDSATAPSATLHPQAAAGLSNGIVVSATGGGEIDLSTAAVGNAKFSFSALQNGDGTASGQFRSVRETPAGLFDVQGEVTCVSVDAANHRAWIGGKVTKNNSTNPAFLTAIHEVGDDVWFRVVDNGEGAAAAADRSSTYGFEGAAGFITSAAYCAGQPWPADDARTFPLSAGNIQVH